MTVSFTPESPVSTVAVRLSFTSAAVSVYVNELQAFAAASGGTRLKVITWNLHKNSGSGTAQGKKLAAQARTSSLRRRPQGTHMPSTIVTALGPGWAHRYHGDHLGGCGDVLQDQSADFRRGGSLRPRPEQLGWGAGSHSRQVDVDGKTLNAFVTHLDWPADDDWTDANEEHVQNRNNWRPSSTFQRPRRSLAAISTPATPGIRSSKPPSSHFDSRAVDSCFVRVTDPTLDTIAEKHTYCDSNSRR